MRKVLTIICALILTALFPAAWCISRGLPADTGSYVAQKYAGWSGVLQAWVCCEWECGGSFVTWLNRCAAQFEKQHEGVYIEFTPVSAQTLGSIGENGMRSPELVFFSPRVLADASILAEIGAPDALRSELRLDEHALPVAMGGTIWVINRELTDTVDPDAIIVPDGFAPAVEALLSGAGAQEEIAPIDPGLDLGLPAFSQSGEDIQSLLDRFVDGELPCLPVTQAEIASLARLRDAGRGPDWECVAAGEYAYTDQLLLAGLTGDGEERHALAREFAHQLLEDDNQKRLADIGAFAVTGQAVHDMHSPYAPLDALLNSRSLAVPDVFSEHSR